MPWRIIVNVGGTSIKCTLFCDGKALLDLRVLGFGLRSLWVYENHKPVPFDSHEPAKAIEFAASRISDYARLHGKSVVQVCYRIKYFRPSPSCFRLDDAALAEIREYGFLQASHYASLIAALEIFVRLFHDAEHLAVPDHALLAGTGVIDANLRVEASMLRRFGLFAIPQHGYVIRSAVASMPNKSVADIDGLLLCHVGSGITVSFVRTGKLRWNSMLYSSCDGPMMTYRTGTLPTGVLLRLASSPANNALRDIFTSSGIYATVHSDDAATLSLSDLIDDPLYERQTKSYVTSIVETILSCLAANGIPRMFVFAGNMLTRSETLFSLIIAKVTQVLGREPVRTQVSSDIDSHASRNHWRYSFVSVDEETQIDQVVSTLTEDDIRLNGRVERFDSDIELHALLGTMFARQERTASAISTAIDQWSYDALHVFPDRICSVFDDPSPVDRHSNAPGTNGQTLYIDRNKRFVHLFSYRDPAHLLKSASNESDLVRHDQEDDGDRNPGAGSW